MSIPLLPEFDADGYQVEPSTAKLNEIITAVNAGGGGGGGATLYAVSYAGTAADDADGWMCVFKAPVAGSVTAAYFMPAVAVTGHDSNRRDIDLFRASPTGTFGNRMANYDFTAAAGAFTHNQVTLTLSATPADVALAEGDYVLFKSDYNGTGATDIVGLVVVEFTPN